jgi:hypothetical protein
MWSRSLARRVQQETSSVAQRSWQARRDNAAADRASAAFVHQGRALSPLMNSIQKAHHGPRVSRQIKAALRAYFLIYFLVIVAFRWGSADRRQRLVPRKLRAALIMREFMARSEHPRGIRCSQQVLTSRCTPWSLRIIIRRLFQPSFFPLRVTYISTLHARVESIFKTSASVNPQASQHARSGLIWRKPKATFCKM